MADAETTVPASELCSDFCDAAAACGSGESAAVSADIFSDFTPQISRCLFGPPYADDLLNPYPVSAEFQPVKAAEAIRGEAEPVFIDFDADPPSLKFVLTNLGFAEERILYDRPDFGKVLSLPPGTCIVCRSAADLEKVKTRFALNQEYEEIFSSGMQKVYRPK